MAVNFLQAKAAAASRSAAATLDDSGVILTQVR
jgi:hypothetical protein